MRVISRIGSNVGRRIDESMPMLDARLPDGSRVNAIIPPLSLQGPCLSVRRFGVNPIDIHKLLELNSITKEDIRSYLLHALLLQKSICPHDLHLGFRVIDMPKVHLNYFHPVL